MARWVLSSKDALRLCFGLPLVSIEGYHEFARGSAREFCFWKNVSPLSCVFCLGLWSDDGCQLLVGKTSPPFWHPSFEFLGVFFALIVCFFRRFFGSYPFVRSKPLGLIFALIVLLPKVFWFGPLKGRSPLALFLHLLCFCRRFFGSDH